MKLRNTRTETRMIANIADGKHVFEGVVVNVSREGLKLKGIPDKFDFYSTKNTVVITDNGKNFKFYINPRWSKKQGKLKEMGFKIISPSLEWIKFINELEGEEVALSPSLH